MTSLTFAVWIAVSAVPSPADSGATDGSGALTANAAAADAGGTLSASAEVASAARGVFLADSTRAASLLQQQSLDATWRPSESSPLRLTDGLRFSHGETPFPLDEGGGVSSDLRQILALILGFVPGFGLGHLVARDRNGFVLFLVIDVALYVVWGVISFGFWGPFGFIGGALWLVVHIIQALDAYAEAGGPRIVQLIRQTTVQVASRALPTFDPPRATAKIFEYSF